MSRRTLKPDAEARRYSKFASAGPWKHWSTGERMWAYAATTTQCTIAYGQKKCGMLPPVWVHALRMQRVLKANTRSKI